MNTNNILGPHYCICSDDQAIFTDNHIYRKMKNLNNTHDIYVLTLLNNQFVWNKTNDSFYLGDINNSNITTENFSDLRCIIKNNNLTIYRIYEDMVTDYINVINFPNENRTDSWRQWEKLNPPLDINELKTMSLLDIPSHIDLTNEEMEEEENQTETYSEGIPLDINFEPLFGWENLLERNPPDDINFKNKNLFNKDISFDDLELNIPNVEYRYDPYDNEWFTKEEFLDYYGGLVEWNNQDPKLVLRREQYYQFSETFKNLSDKRFKFLFNKYEKTFV